MGEPAHIHIWAMRALFVLLCFGVIFCRILPLDTLPPGWVGPDLITALAFAWVLRRPKYAPSLLIAAVVLLADLMFHRPPGLWAALVVLGCEALKVRAPGLRDMGFGPEWLAAASVTVATMLTYRLTLAILVVPQAPLGLSLMQMVMTVLCYPLVVAVSGLVFGVRKPRPSDGDGRRARL